MLYVAGYRAPGLGMGSLVVNDLRQAVYTIEDQKTRPCRRIESYEAELLVELI